MAEGPVGRRPLLSRQEGPVETKVKDINGGNPPPQTGTEVKDINASEAKDLEIYCISRAGCVAFSLWAGPPSTPFPSSVLNQIKSKNLRWPASYC